MAWLNTKRVTITVSKVVPSKHQPSDTINLTATELEQMHEIAAAMFPGCLIEVDEIPHSDQSLITRTGIGAMPMPIDCGGAVTGPVGIDTRIDPRIQRPRSTAQNASEGDE